MEDPITIDLKGFGLRELKMAEALIRAYREHGLPKDFYDEGVHIMFNRHSGYVFLTNSEYQVAMEADGHLYSFYSCGDCGHEGFEEDGFSGEDKSLCDECKNKEKKQ